MPVAAGNGMATYGNIFKMNHCWDNISTFKDPAKQHLPEDASLYFAPLRFVNYLLVVVISSQARHLITYRLACVPMRGTA